MALLFAKIFDLKYLTLTLFLINGIMTKLPEEIWDIFNLFVLLEFKERGVAVVAGIGACKMLEGRRSKLGRFFEENAGLGMVEL